MAEHIHRTYSCDRCKDKISHDDAFPKYGQQIIVNASFNWMDGPGPSFSWKHLCKDCRASVLIFFKQ